MGKRITELAARSTRGACAVPIPGETAGWRLQIPGGASGQYRLAQLDDYSVLPRRNFPWQPPITISLRARVSADDIPGTWGFGLWNDPFGISLGFGGRAGRLPALPNAAWFFHASPANHLSLRDDLPAHGFLAATYQSPKLPSMLLLPCLFFLPLLAIRPAARWGRRLARRFIRQEAASIETDVVNWTDYEIQWLRACVAFKVNGKQALQTRLAPAAPLALVIWIDNQFAAFTPQGKLAYGTLASTTGNALEISNLQIKK